MCFLGNNMKEAIVLALEGVPRELAVILLGAVPIGELRLAIPVGILHWNMGPVTVFCLAILGNLIPFFPLYFGLATFRKILEKVAPWSVRFLDRLVLRAERKVSGHFARYGAWALAVFVGIPLPLTGLYTATLAAVALKIPVRQAFAGILFGLLCSGAIVTFLTISGRFVL